MESMRKRLLAQFPELFVDEDENIRKTASKATGPSGSSEQAGAVREEAEESPDEKKRREEEEEAKKKKQRLRDAIMDFKDKQMTQLDEEQYGVRESVVRHLVSKLPEWVGDGPGDMSLRREATKLAGLQADKGAYTSSELREAMVKVCCDRMKCPQASTRYGPRPHTLRNHKTKLAVLGKNREELRAFIMNTDGRGWQVQQPGAQPIFNEEETQALLASGEMSVLAPQGEAPHPDKVCERARQVWVSEKARALRSAGNEGAARRLENAKCSKSWFYKHLKHHSAFSRHLRDGLDKHKRAVGIAKKTQQQRRATLHTLHRAVDASHQAATGGHVDRAMQRGV